MSEARARADAVVDRYEPPVGIWFKYGRARHLREAVDRGRLRVNPASKHGRASLPAIQDNERERRRELEPAGIVLHVCDGRTMQRKGSIRPTRFAKVRVSTTNYYLYCMSRRWSADLFVDFGADACLWIDRPDEFCDEVLATLEEACPGWAGVHRPVTYVAADAALPPGIPMFEMKDVRYEAQAEERLIWLPENGPAIHLDPVLLAIPGLPSSLKLITLDQA